jgi:hypothetical protein
MSVSTSKKRSRCWCGLHVEVHYVKKTKYVAKKENIGHFTDLYMRSLQTRERKITSLISFFLLSTLMYLPVVNTVSIFSRRHVSRRSFSRNVKSEARRFPNPNICYITVCFCGTSTECIVAGNSILEKDVF